MRNVKMEIGCRPEVAAVVDVTKSSDFEVRDCEAVQPGII